MNDRVFYAMLLPSALFLAAVAYWIEEGSGLWAIILGCLGAVGPAAVIACLFSPPSRRKD